MERHSNTNTPQAHPTEDGEERDVLTRELHDKVRRSEERYRAVMEQATEAIFLVDADSKQILEANAAFQKLLGYAAEDVAGLTIYDLLPYDSERIDSTIQRILAEGHYPVRERVYRRKNGTLVDVELSITPISYGGNRVLCQSLRDITQRKRADAALEASLSLLRATLEATADGILAVDDKGRTITFNQRFVELWGIPDSVLASGDDSRAMEFILEQLQDPTAFSRKVQEIYERPNEDSFDILEFKDGRTFERYSRAQQVSGQNVGRVWSFRDVTERKHAQEALRTSESNYRILVEQASDGIFVADIAGNLVDVNEKGCEMLGYERDDLLKRHVDDIVTLPDPETTQASVLDLAAGNTIRAEHLMYRKDGTSFPVEIGSKLLPNGLFQGIARDITERKQAQEALTKAKDELEIRVAERTAELRRSNEQLQQELVERLRTQEALRLSEEKFRAIFEHAPVMINSFTEDGRCLLWNAECEKQLGYTFEQVQPAGAMLRLGYPEPTGRDNVLEAIALKDGSFKEQRVRAADGTYRHQMWAIFVLPNTDLISIGYDITERKLAEQALNASEARYRAVVEDQIDLISRYLPDGTFTFVNEAHCRYWRRTREELLGVSFLDLIPANERAAAERILASLTPENSISSHVQKVVNDDGSVGWLHWIDRAFFDDEGNVIEFQSVGSDVTEREIAKEAAEEANRAKSEFLSRMSHELRTPLNAILGFGQLLELEDDPSPEHRDSVSYILQGGRHLLQLINEVLDISQIESGRMSLSLQPVSVPDVLQQCLDLVSPLAVQRNIHLDSAASLEPALRTPHSPFRVCYVQADYQRLKQVMLNLLANAVKYNREGGSVSVDWEQRAGEAGEEDSGQRVIIKVIDTGPGIGADKIGRLFTPFDRLGAEKTDVEGTGLGLALSRRLVEAMGGALGVDSKRGEGSTFWVNLPLAYTPAEHFAHDHSHNLGSGTLPDVTHTVLYVEDNLSNLKLVEGIMKHDPGIEIIAAMQGRIGLDLAREHHPDLILLDLHLPDMQGEEVLRILRDDPITSSIPVLILSADAIPGQSERLLAAGAHAYITKPLNIREFLNVVGEVLYVDLDME